jgi:hypothetical protein
VLGIQPLNLLEHATQIIAEATALLELNSTKRAKLPAQSLEAFLNSVITLAKKTREQPSAQEILGKLNSLQPIAEDITLIKNAVNNVLASIAVVAVWSTTSPLFSCFAAMTRGPFPSRFIRDPRHRSLVCGGPPAIPCGERPRNWHRVSLRFPYL